MLHFGLVAKVGLCLVSTRHVEVLIPGHQTEPRSPLFVEKVIHGLGTGHKLPWAGVPGIFNFSISRGWNLHLGNILELAGI